MGIVQDSLLGIYLMTMRDTFITRTQLMSLIMWMDPLTKYKAGDLPMPCILKPEPLWSGKQVISMIIP
jgi:DNA-directed RNA polymerase II subunit RPB1